MIDESVEKETDDPSCRSDLAQCLSLRLDSGGVFLCHSERTEVKSVSMACL